MRPEQQIPSKRSPASSNIPRAKKRTLEKPPDPNLKEKVIHHLRTMPPEGICRAGMEVVALMGVKDPGAWINSRVDHFGTLIRRVILFPSEPNQKNPPLDPDFEAALDELMKHSEGARSFGILVQKMCLLAMAQMFLLTAVERQADQRIEKALKDATSEGPNSGAGEPPVPASAGLLGSLGGGTPPSAG